MRTHRYSVTVLCSLLLAATAFAATPKFDTLAPEDTLVYGALRSVADLEKAITSGPSLALWREPSVQRFFHIDQRSDPEHQFIQPACPEGGAMSALVTHRVARQRDHRAVNEQCGP